MLEGLQASVLVPLMDDRATGERCVRAWTQEQTFPRDRYEVIALAPGVDPELEAAVRPLLTPRDHWVVADSRIVVELLNIGAQRAGGHLLFLTESHCEPDSACLAELVAHLDRTGEIGARGSSVGRAEGELGAFERDIYRRGQAEGEADGHWNRVLIHSFAIRRDVFLDVGGFRSDLGDFSNFALGIELRERGLALGHAPRAVVHHTYDGDLQGLGVHLRDFGRGEAAYFGETSRDVRERYLVEPAEWTDRRSFTRRGARRALRAAVGVRKRDRGVAREAARHALVAVAGPRGAAALAQAQAAATAVRIRSLRGHPTEQARAFGHWWRYCARAGRIDLLAARPAVPEAPLAGPHLDLTTIDGPHLMGFHVVEESQGRRFRWTSPLALVEAALPHPGRYTARLEVAPIRPAADSGLHIAVDGRLVPPGSYRYEPEGVRFGLRGGGVRWLAFATTTLRPRRDGSEDHRDLGLAVSGLTFEPV